MKSTSRTTTFSVSVFVIIDSIPTSCFPVDSSIIGTNIVAHHNKCNIIQDHTIVSPIVTIQDAIDTSPWWLKMLLQHYCVYDVEDFISNLVYKTRTFIIVSDGGYKDYYGSFGVAIGTHNTTLCKIEDPAPGHSELGSSFRSEGYGMLAGLAFLRLIIQTYKPSKDPSGQTIKVYCDNLALVNCAISILKHELYTSAGQLPFLCRLYH